MTNPVDLWLSQLPLASSVNASDYTLVNQGAGASLKTRRTQIGNLFWSTQSPSTPDPLFPYVVLLIQNGSVQDRSQYGRALTDIGGITPVDPAATPSGNSIRVVGSLVSNGVGISWAFNAVSTPELVYGSTPLCIELFFRQNSGAVPAGANIIYADASGFQSSGLLWTNDESTGLMRQDWNNSPVGGITLQPALAKNTVYHLALQKIGQVVTTYINGVGYTSSGPTPPVSVNDPFSPIFLPPAIGRMGSVGSNEDFNFDQYRITRGQARYTTNFTPPTALFPTFGP